MIFATTKPVEEYKVVVLGTEYGLYPQLQDRPELLALILLITPLGYDYETEKTPIDVRTAPKDLFTYTKTLNHLLNGEVIKDLLNRLTPLQFYETLVSLPQSQLEAIPFVKNMLNSDTSSFLGIVGARAAAWALTQKREIKRTGKITWINFKGVDVSQDLVNLHNQFKEFVERGL